MKIFIITEGGKDIGFGHITRCISLGQAFEEKEIIPEFVINGNGSTESLLKGTKYQIFNWLEDKSRLFKLVEDSDIAIIDSYLADFYLYEHLSEIVKTPVYIDDTKRLDYPRGIVVNGGIYAEKLAYPERDGVRYLLGTQYIPLRRSFWKVSEKEIKENMESVMVTFGGDDLMSMTLKTLKLLREKYPSLKKNVIIGRAFKDIDEIKKEADKNTILVYHPNAEKMKEMMLRSDVAISAGGQTLYELARVGVPTLGVCISKNQELNLRGFYESSLLKFIGWYNDNKLAGKMTEMIEEFLIKKERKKYSFAGQKLVDGLGAKRVVGRILSSA